MTALRTILVATDFSPLSELAFAQAVELSSALGGALHVLHVYTLPGLPEGAVLASRNIDDAELVARKKLDALVQEHAAEGRTLSTSVRLGDPADVIVRVAEELRAELIVLGTHGRRGLRRLLVGSVAEAVVRAAPCSVLVARHATEQAE